MPTTGPIIVAQSFLRTPGPVNSLRVQFNRAIDVATFTPDKVTFFSGPLGAIPVTDVTVVPGSGDRQFDIAFPTQFITSVYVIHIGPYIYDRFGMAMDHDLSGPPGEAGDLYVGWFGIEGPRVLRSEPTGTVLGPVERVRVTFNVPMNPATFTRRDIVSWFGPLGRVAVLRVEAVPDSGNTQFDIVPRNPLTAVGDYELVFGPDVRDTWGNPMDQNDNLIAGEGLADAFAANFTIITGLPVTVEANQFFNSTGILAVSGEVFQIVATGVVDISADNGGYRIDPDGTIQETPPVGSGSYNYFLNVALPRGVPPLAGTRKYLDPNRGHVPGGAYGALVAGFSPNPQPTSMQDFPWGFVVVGTSGVVTAPGAGYLFLASNDIDNTSNNTGSFQAVVQHGRSYFSGRGAEELVGEAGAVVAVFGSLAFRPARPAVWPLATESVGVVALAARERNAQVMEAGGQAAWELDRAEQSPSTSWVPADGWMLADRIANAIGSDEFAEQFSP